MTDFKMLEKRKTNLEQILKLYDKVMVNVYPVHLFNPFHMFMLIFHICKSV